MAGIMDTIYGPLDRKYCLYFYYLSIIGFVLFILMLLSTLYIGIVKKKDSSFYLSMIIASLGYGIFYFQNRLLYSMCIHST
jgi:hypothetical protein